MNTTLFNRFMKAVAFTLAIIASPAFADKEVNETRSMAADGFVSLSNTAGSVEVAGWDRDEMQITGTLDDAADELKITASGNGFRIEVIHPRNTRNLGDTDLVLRMPEGASLEVETVSADIQAEGLSGERVLVHSVSGDLVIACSSEMVDLATVSGEIEYRGSATRTRVETVSGDAEISGVRDELAVNTVSGDISITDVQLRNGRFETVSGDLELSFDLDSDARITVDSLSGDVNMALSDDLSARVQASSFSGNLDTDFGNVNRGRFGPQSHFETVVGDGQGQIRIESFSGDIELSRR